MKLPARQLHQHIVAECGGGVGFVDVSDNPVE